VKGLLEEERLTVSVRHAWWMQSKLARAGHIDRRINVLATRPKKVRFTPHSGRDFSHRSSYRARLRENV
jgi:hypothetical protein